MSEKNHFEELYKVNVNSMTEKKNGLTYLSWANAYAEFLKVYPDAVYEIVKFDGLPYTFDPLTGYMVYTKVTAGGITREMWLPVMDGANRAMKAVPYNYTVKNPNHKYAKKQPDGRWIDSYGNEQPEYLTKTCDAATMFDVNKTIMRCLVKNLAMFGLGLYIYAGEDLPEDEKQQEPPKAPAKQTKKQEPKKTADQELKDRSAEKITENMRKALETRCDTNGVDVAKVCELYKVENLGELTIRQLKNINENWDKCAEMCKKEG